MYSNIPGIICANFMKELWQVWLTSVLFSLQFSADTAVLYDFSYFSGNWEKSEKNWADAKLSVLYVKKSAKFSDEPKSGRKIRERCWTVLADCCFCWLVDLLFG